jgi:hypothetical protein
MKKNRTSWLAAGASLLLAAFAPQAQSAQVVYNTGDIILAFRASAGQGELESLLVNVGPASTFTVGIGTSVINDLSLGNLGADLVAQFGANWYSRTDLTWAVFGSNDPANPAATLYASRAQSTFGTDATAWPGLSNAANRTATRSAIQSVAAAFDTLDATANSTVAALQTNSAAASSYKQQVTGGSTDFGSVSQWTNIEGNFGPGSEALNLFRVAASTTNLGKFTISELGQVTFNGTNVDITAVPEPSKALFGMMGSAAIFLRRRRPSAKATA